MKNHFNVFLSSFSQLFPITKPQFSIEIEPFDFYQRKKKPNLLYTFISIEIKRGTVWNGSTIYQSLYKCLLLQMCGHS